MVLRIVTQTYRDTNSENGLYNYRVKIQKRVMCFWWKDETDYQFETDWDAQEYINQKYTWTTIEELGCNKFKLN